MSPLSSLSSLSNLSQPETLTLPHEPDFEPQYHNIRSIQTNYDFNCADNKRQPAHIHDRQKNLVWTQAERLLAACAEEPTSIEDLEHKVVF